MHKICAIHQPNFFPWLGYFYKIAQSDVFVLYDTVQIELNSQQAYVNRTKIKTANGVQWLTCPVIRDNDMTIRNVKCTDKFNWKKKHLKTLYFAYKKSKNFNRIFPRIENIYNRFTHNLAANNEYAIKEICTLLDIDTKIVKASDLNFKDGGRTQKLVHICQSLGAGYYLSGKGGIGYHDLNVFKTAGIQIKTTDFSHAVYVQLHDNDFVSGLSILDAMFNMNNKKLKYLIHGEH